MEIKKSWITGEDLKKRWKIDNDYLLDLTLTKRLTAFDGGHNPIDVDEIKFMMDEEMGYFSPYWEVGFDGFRFRVEDIERLERSLPQETESPVDVEAKRGNEESLNEIPQGPPAETEATVAFKGPLLPNEKPLIGYAAMAKHLRKSEETVKKWGLVEKGYAQSDLRGSPPRKFIVSYPSLLAEFLSLKLNRK
jgi:hypothetical protein